MHKYSNTVQGEEIIFPVHTSCPLRRRTTSTRSSRLWIWSWAATHRWDFGPVVVVSGGARGGVAPWELHTQSAMAWADELHAAGYSKVEIMLACKHWWAQVVLAVPSTYACKKRS